MGLAGEFAEEFPLVHVVLEGFAAVDEDDGNFVGKLAAQFFVAIHIHLMPSETTAALQLAKSFFDDFTQVTALAGVDDDLAQNGHGGSLAPSPTFSSGTAHEDFFGGREPALSEVGVEAVSGPIQLRCAHLLGAG